MAATLNTTELTTVASMAKKLGHGQKQVEAWYCTFRDLDQNGDGKLTTEELRQMLLDCGQNASEEDAREIMDNLDHNEDGGIDFHEFCVFMGGTAGGESETPQQMEDNLLNAFKMIDGDGDGYIDFKEFKAFLKTVEANSAKQTPDNEIEDTFNDADTNQDGKLGYAEFRILMGVDEN